MILRCNAILSQHVWREVLGAPGIFIAVYGGVGVRAQGAGAGSVNGMRGSRSKPGNLSQVLPPAC